MSTPDTVGEVKSSFSLAMPRSITGSCISGIGETPKKLPFLRRGVEKIAYRIFFVKLTPPSYGHLPYILHNKTQGRRVVLFIL